jgi:hypothetical protein
MGPPHVADVGGDSFQRGADEGSVRGSGKPPVLRMSKLGTVIMVDGRAVFDPSFPELRRLRSGTPGVETAVDNSDHRR